MAVFPLIYNPVAGGGKRDMGRDLTAEFRRLGVEVELLRTTGAGDATRLAREAVRAGVARLVAAGGDGTINEVVNGLAGSETELAVIPMGTANVLALELEIPVAPARACELAVKGNSITVDLGLAGERYFILMAGVGFDALVIKNINPALKRTIRRGAFPLSGLKTFFGEKLSLLTINADGRKTHGFFVIASNSRYYGGRFGPTPLASMADGLLDICVLKGRSLPEMIKFWIGALGKGTVDTAVAESFRATGIRVSCEPGVRVPVQTDGEVVAELPVSISVAPAALKICAGGQAWS
ncbi:diacylglycerol kinase [bacterium BMS3Abin01]|nr:diacylglycerol kinase [bacterium BMS3Abin01]